MICDRCKLTIEGTGPLYWDHKMRGINKTSIVDGYYDVSIGYWNRFRKNNEINVCAKCMYNDNEYIKHYTYLYT
jgi:hypothetical protein